MSPFVRRFPRLTFFLAGLMVSTACFWFLTQWVTIFNGWLGLSVTYDTRPAWLVVLMSVATAGVPQAAASVNVSPQPSASDALATTQARR